MSAAVLHSESLAWGYDASAPLGRDLQLELEPGEALAIVGPNGAGKSTLLRTLAGARAPLDGRVLVGGQDISALSLEQRARRLALLPQDEAVDLDLTVRELVQLGRTPYLGAFGRLSRDDQSAVEEALEACELAPLASRALGEISGGERQRARLAMCLAQRVPLLLLDEPTSHLDLRRRYELFEQLAALRAERELAVVVVLHDLVDAYDAHDRVLVVADGEARVVARDDREALARAFGVPEKRIPV
ncbi:MAG: ABC transporter ATP-binding protein [Myxococcales bacterium]|nr:ABC transporter ATP-binding protein [Myxococcales bacterium]